MCGFDVGGDDDDDDGGDTAFLFLFPNAWDTLYSSVQQAASSIEPNGASFA